MQHHQVGEDQLHALASADRLRVWCLHWAQVAPRSASVVPPEAAMDSGQERWPWGAPADALGRWLMGDVGGTPRLQVAAAALGLAPRTLQRQLARLGIRYGELVGEVRVRRAAGWLVRSPHSLAEIGYLCGYADQSHMIAEFRRFSSLTPQMLAREKWFHPFIERAKARRLSERS